MQGRSLPNQQAATITVAEQALRKAARDIAGARVTGMYPMSVIMPGGGINITCFSSAGNVDFGITIEPDLVPEPWQVIDGLHSSLSELLALTGKKSARRKKANTRSKTTARQKKGPATKSKARQPKQRRS